MTRKLIPVLATLALAGSPAGAAAASDSELRPLFACLTLADTAARLACFDRETRLLENRQPASSDRDDPAGGSEQPAERRAARPAATRTFQPIDDVLVEVTLFSGRWLFATKNNGIWQQAVDLELGRTPRVGDRLRVRRGALGSFLANVGDGPAVRVRRLR